MRLTSNLLKAIIKLYVLGSQWMFIIMGCVETSRLDDKMLHNWVEHHSKFKRALTHVLVLIGSCVRCWSRNWLPKVLANHRRVLEAPFFVNL